VAGRELSASVAEAAAPGEYPREELAAHLERSPAEQPKPIGCADLQRVLSAALRTPQTLHRGEPVTSSGELIGFTPAMREVQKKIGDMPVEMQAKILRILEDRTVTPVGGQSSQQVDVRIIAATHRDLPSAVADGTFRKDLYYRLNALTIEVPALRQRVSDILILAKHFLVASKLFAQIFESFGG
jgi:Sigma-54 interaction domain